MNKELIELLAKARYLSKRAFGISGTRSDGSECSEINDINATGAEYFACQQYNVPFNAGIGAFGDGGSDFSIDLSVEVIWLGAFPSGEPRQDGHLIVNPHEPHRWADVYVVVKGSVDIGFSEVGWITHSALIEMPKKDFGFGPRFACHTSKLKSPNLLKGLKKGLSKNI